MAWCTTAVPQPHPARERKEWRIPPAMERYITPLTRRACGASSRAGAFACNFGAVVGWRIGGGVAITDRVGAIFRAQQREFGPTGTVSRHGLLIWNRHGGDRDRLRGLADVWARGRVD